LQLIKAIAAISSVTADNLRFSNFKNISFKELAYVVH
jgi:hypothetical protein